MSSQTLNPELFVDLSTQEQELLSGGMKRCCRWRRVCVRYCPPYVHSSR